jgi:hypothetical protein
VGGDGWLDHVLDQVLADRRKADVGTVLGGDDDRLHGDGLAVDVADGDLALPVGTQIVERPRPAHRGEALHELVREHDGQWHQLRRLRARVAEHQALVARPQLVHADGNVARLLVDGRDHAARLVVEAVLGPRVAHLLDGLARDPGNVHVAGGGDLACYHHEAGGEERLASDAARGVLGQDGVQDRIGDLIGDLVRMPLGHGLRSEQILLTRHRASSSGGEYGAGGLTTHSGQPSMALYRAQAKWALTTRAESRAAQRRGPRPTTRRGRW